MPLHQYFLEHQGWGRQLLNRYDTTSIPMKSLPILNRLIPPLLMTVNIIHVLYYLVIGGIALIVIACGTVKEKNQRDMALISAYCLGMIIPALLLVGFYFRALRKTLGPQVVRIGWIVSCIYHGLTIWIDVFINHGTNRLPVGGLSIPFWTLSALSFVASLYAFLLLLDEHSQTTERKQLLS